MNCYIYFVESLCFRMQLMHVTAFRDGTETARMGVFKKWDVLSFY